jgi:hypothetical protein
MTEEQKMEEGKRMFSIFAARMFEQRVLQAYREKVAQERQLQLLRELEDEDKMSKEREAKKQTQNQKKKDKKRSVFCVSFGCFRVDSVVFLLFVSQQKQAKDEERAQKAAEKAAEEAATKAKQAALEEEIRKKREEERLRREAAKKASEEERLKKEEEKRKRALDEKEREAERERKRKEKEERVRADRKEREEKERKLREEREAKAAKEKEEKMEKERVEKEKADKARAEKEQFDKDERDKKLAKEREEKAEREARERLVVQQRAAVSPGAGSSKTSTVRASGSSRNSIVASSSSPNQRFGANINGTASRKAVTKAPSFSSSSSTPLPGQPTRQHSQGPQNAPQQPQAQQPSRGPSNMSQPSTPISPQIPSHTPLPNQSMMYGQGGPVMLPQVSPRIPSFPPIGFGIGGPNMQPSGQGVLAPSPLPRNFSAGGPAFDPAYNRGVIGGGLPPPVAPIGPPPKGKASIAASGSAPSLLSLAPGQGRRGSVLADGPGPVARPIAPIARPTTAGTSGGGEGSSGSGSPVRRSPSPKGVLGSSALVEDGDEVVMASTGRRGGATPIGMGSVSQGWGPASPRSAVGTGGTPWGAPPGFVGSPRPSGPPPPVGPLNNQHLPQAMIGSGSVWGNSALPSAPPTGLNPDWHPSGNYFTNQFTSHRATSPPPHGS